MAHELNRIAELPHESMTQLIVYGGAGGLLVVGIAAYFAWRDRRAGRRLGGRQRRRRSSEPPRKR